MASFISFLPYTAGMAEKSKLRELREAAEISVRELARQIGQQPTNVSYWERTGQLPRSDVLIPMAKALGVSVEELLGQERPARLLTPPGKLGQVFEAVAKLPRKQQEKVIEMAEGFLSLHQKPS